MRLDLAVFLRCEPLNTPSPSPTHLSDSLATTVRPSRNPCPRDVASATEGHIQLRSSEEPLKTSTKTRIAAAVLGTVALAIGVPSNADAAASVAWTCKDVTAVQRATAPFGTTVFWLKVQVSWCFNGTSMNYRWNRVTDYANGYLFWDTTSPDVSVRGGSPYVVYAREKMEHCAPLPWSSYCNYRWPWVEITARANGTYSIIHGID